VIRDEANLRAREPQGRMLPRPGIKVARRKR
jgi:hypothetical protein